MTKYKVVRTYDDGKNDSEMAKLTSAFDAGYEFVRASEYIPEAIHNGNVRRYGYIEYILKKEVKE